MISSLNLKVSDQVSLENLNGQIAIQDETQSNDEKFWLEPQVSKSNLK